MKVSIFGLGYVGSVSLGCLAELGHTVVGVDVNTLKVNMINAGESPVIEAGMADLIAKGAKDPQSPSQLSRGRVPLERARAPGDGAGGCGG